MLRFGSRTVVWVLCAGLSVVLAGCGGEESGSDSATGATNPPPGGTPPPLPGGDTNQAPTASNVNVWTNAETAVSGAMSGTDPDAGDTLTYTVEGDPSDGTLTAVSGSAGNFTYTPDNGFSGADSFTFRVADSSNASDTATVTINVNPPGVNSAPTAQTDSATTNQGQTIMIDVLANDLDLADQPITVSIVGASSHGTAVVQADNQVEYTPSMPNPTYLGPDSLIYEVRDASGDVSMASVDITVDCPAASCNRTFEASWAPVNDPDVTGYCIHHDIDSGAPYADMECIGTVNSYSWPLDVASGTDYFAITTTYNDGDVSNFSQEVTVNSF